MKKVLALVLCCVLLLCGCSKKSAETIVGQWKCENGERYYIIESDGTIFEVSTNAMDEYITTVRFTEDGDYYTNNEWYKVGEEYHWLNPSFKNEEFPNGWDRVVRIDEDTMVIGDDIYEWHRLPKSKWISKKKIYYSTYDEKSKAYIDHPLSELD